MDNHVKRAALAVMMMIASVFNVFPAMAAYDINGNEVTVSMEELTADVPAAVLGQYYESGGKVEYMADDIQSDDGTVKAVYNNLGDGGYLIRVSLDSYGSMMPYYFDHEMGHWLYDVTAKSEEDTAVINAMTERWANNGAFTGINTTEKEIFANMYANYLDSDGMYLTGDEKAMFERLENQVKDIYYAAHPELDRAAMEAAEEPDYANMPDWKLASYGPTVWYQYRNR